MHYRRIYEEYHQCSLLPGIEIHHIDGNHQNNDPCNLLAVTIEEHLDIHYKQEDWGAVQAILMRMDNKNDEIKEIARHRQIELLKKGEHNFQKMSKDRRKEISTKVGHLTKDLQIGIHRINSDPILAKENARNGGIASQMKRKRPEYSYLNTLAGKAVSGTKWFRNIKTGERVRKKTKPDGDDWIQGTGPQNKRTLKSSVKNTFWWIDTVTNKRCRSSKKPSGDNWKKGYKNDNDK